MNGTLKFNVNSRVYSEDRTYDSKLHTFKEMNYKKEWQLFKLIVRKIDNTHKLENISKTSSRY
jgi:hypothetical protein